MSIRLEQKDAALIIHNQEAKRGAIQPELYEAIKAAMQTAEAPAIRAVILTGGPFFCAGGDLTQLKERASLPETERRARIEQLHDVIRAMHACPVPLIAAIEGGAAGAGLSFALACDLIVAAENATFTAAYVKVGLTPDGGLTSALSRLLPRQLAMEACLFGTPISAETLNDLGVITRLCPKGQTLTEAETLARQISEGPRQAQSQICALMRNAGDLPLQAQMDREVESMAKAVASPEAAEGMAAFFEKRPPVFRS